MFAVRTPVDGILLWVLLALRTLHVLEAARFPLLAVAVTERDALAYFSFGGKVGWFICMRFGGGGFILCWRLWS